MFKLEKSSIKRRQGRWPVNNVTVKSGDGQGPMGAALNPHPRNFTCGETMNDLPDGQLFWIIKKGSPGTGMMAFSGMPDNQIWQLISLYS